MRFVAALDTAIFGVRYTQGAVVDTSEWSRKMVLKYLDSGILAPADTGVLDFGELTLDKLGDVSDTPAVDGQVLVRVAGQWTPGDAPPATISDATTTAKGVLKLAGDLGGTADAPTVPELANKETAGTASTLMNNHVSAPDPHPQYLTAAEGNAAYDAAGAATSAVNAHVAAADPHTQYYNQSRGDARYLRTLGMSGLTDVDLTGLTDGYVLKWVQASGKWTPVAMSGGGGTSLPTGGATNQGLVKASATDGDVRWATVVLNETSTSTFAPTNVTSSGAYSGVPSDAFTATGLNFGSAAPVWLQADLGTAKVATSYSFQARSGELPNAWAAWTFQGSNDAATWTTLDTRSAQAPPAGTDSVYTFPNSTSYRYYRWNISASVGGGANWVTVKLVTLKGTTKTSGLAVAGLLDVAAATPADGDVLTFETSTALWKNKPVPSPAAARIPLSYTRMGDIAVATGTKKVYNDTGSTRTIDIVRASLATGPTGSSLIIDVKKNGTTIFTTSGNRPTVAAGSDTGTGVPDVTAWAAGEYLTMDVVQVGSTTPGTDLTMTITVH